MRWSFHACPLHARLFHIFCPCPPCPLSFSFSFLSLSSEFYAPPRRHCNQGVYFVMFHKMLDVTQVSLWQSMETGLFQPPGALAVFVRGSARAAPCKCAPVCIRTCMCTCGLITHMLMTACVGSTRVLSGSGCSKW